MKYHNLMLILMILVLEMHTDGHSEAMGLQVLWNKWMVLHY